MILAREPCAIAAACEKCRLGVAPSVGLRSTWGMKRHVLVQSVLLPRLLAAIGAGTLLAAPSCGGKTDSTSGSASNGVDGENTRKERDAQAETTRTDNTTPNTRVDAGATASAPPPSKPAPTSVVTDPATGVTNPSVPTATHSQPATSTDAPFETSADAGQSIEGESDAQVAALDSGPADQSGYQCDYGEPQRFCLSVEGMEHQARWGVGNELRTEPLRSDDEIATGWDENGCMKSEWIASGCCNPALSAGELQKDGSCCYIACEGVCCGRPFIVNGVSLVADVTERKDWCADAKQVCIAVADLSTRERETLAQAWLADAQMEHASIASFSQFALDLLQLGAPPELLRDCHLAGLDEIEHARVGFAVTSMLLGRDVGPGELAVGSFQSRSLEQALTAAIVEGCVGETLAAGVVAEQARRCTDVNLAKQLEKIATDELRHAELAWRFVAWATQRFGTEARRVAQRAFAQALANPPSASAELQVSDQVLHSLGRITASQWQNAVTHVLRDVIEPATKALLVTESAKHNPGRAHLIAH